MKKHIALFTIIGAALFGASASIHAQDAASTNSATATEHVKKHGAPFHGKVTAVDTTAMTVTVGTKTFDVTSDTKITKDGQPATLTDVTVGEVVAISYKKGDAGKLNATTIHIGAKKKKTD
jgi:Domain of unknown function (DUF5666)